MFKLSKKIALPLIAVLLIGTGVGGYFLFRNFQLPRYFVDRYPELLEYCDTEESKDGLKISCKALMLDIRPNVSDGIPSLTSLIIANDEELKEYTITEKEEVFAWTNEVLQFKKLKPIIINIQYTKKNPITYSIQGITFEDIPETYIQEIVNRDIEEIMGMDKSSTTILNSFDFCPRPETLPDYVVKKEEYAKYWGENILSEDEYKNGYNYNLDDTTIRLLFACDSAKNRNMIDICTRSTEIIKTKTNESLISNNENLYLLKLITTIYDLNNMDSLSKPFNIDYILKILDVSLKENPYLEQQALCALKYTGLSEQVVEFSYNGLDSFLCRSIFSDLLNTPGLYIRGFFSDEEKNLKLLDRCHNLNFYLLVK